MGTRQSSSSARRTISGVIGGAPEGTRVLLDLGSDLGRTVGKRALVTPDHRVQRGRIFRVLRIRAQSRRPGAGFQDEFRFAARLEHQGCCATVWIHLARRDPSRRHLQTYLSKVRTGTDPDDVAGAKEWLLTYNEDDKAAIARIRDGLRLSAVSDSSDAVMRARMPAACPRGVPAPDLP